MARRQQDLPALSNLKLDLKSPCFPALKYLMKIGLQTSVRQFKNSRDLKNSTFNPLLRKQNAKFGRSCFVKWGLHQIHGLAPISFDF